MYTFGAKNVDSKLAEAYLKMEIEKDSFVEFLTKHNLDKETLLKLDFMCLEVNLLAIEDEIDILGEDKQFDSYAKQIIKEEVKSEDGYQLLNVGTTSIFDIQDKMFLFTYIWSYSPNEKDRLLAVGISILEQSNPPKNFYVPIISSAD